ncbi:alpha/beta hydrolase [Ruegeria jejuensis]|uniref:alpha/beta hydrolase n=1 Tax=Ruegeria jejuensis TaxID=3233338 RepID=UPI00355C88DB
MTDPAYGSVPLRIYRTNSDQNAPVIVFFHGGGHVFGDLRTSDTTARFLALKTGCTLISVGYRKAPEHPFPAAVEDSFSALRWVMENAGDLSIDPARLALCGDSAGGNLAAVAAMMARDAGIAVAAQALIYPVIDYRGGTGSYDRYGAGYGILETDTVAWFRERYLPDPTMYEDWRANPGLAPSHVGLPPALVLTAECDVLHDEGAAYAQQLRHAGVSVEQVDFSGMIHGFFSYLGLVDDAERAHETVARYLSEAWAETGKGSLKGCLGAATGS